MATVITSPADVINLALGRIGYKDRIGSIFEGSEAAKQALDIYAQTRDAALREFDWGFAERIAAGVVASQAAPFPWAVSYVYPADCLRLRNMFDAAYVADRNNPLPVLYTIANNATDGNVIWSNSAAANLVYTAQITDPTKWEPLFVEMFADMLSVGLGPVLASLEATKSATEGLKVAAATAEDTVG